MKLSFSRRQPGAGSTAERGPSGVPGPGTRVPAFDGVRGIAILAVIVYHAGSLVASTAPIDRLVEHVTGAGWLGVDLFFVLSGFLITGILIDTKGESGFFRSFYARRTLRIFPLFYAVVMISVLLIPLAVKLGLGPDKAHVYSHDLWRNQLWLWTYTHNYLQAGKAHTLPGLGHLWSLAVEEQFYLAWPLVVFITPRRRLLATAVAICVAVTALRIFLSFAHVDPWALRTWTFTRIDTLLLGGVAAIIVRTPSVWARVKPYLLPVMGLATAALVAATAIRGTLALDSPFSARFVYSVAAVGFAAAMVWLCGASARPLEAAWLRRVGFYSYAMYVFHWPIAQLTAALFRRAGLADALTVGGSQLLLVGVEILVVAGSSFIAAAISWRLWEERWLRLKSRFAYQGESKASAVAHSASGDVAPETTPETTTAPG